MNRHEQLRQRLLRAARQAPPDASGERSSGFAPRVVAHWRVQARARLARAAWERVAPWAALGGVAALLCALRWPEPGAVAAPETAEALQTLQQLAQP